MSDLPVIVVPPCDELEMVVDYLWTQHLVGKLVVTPSMWRDLDALKGMCLYSNAITEGRLETIERLYSRGEQ